MLGWVGLSPLENEAQPCDVLFLVLVTLRLSSADSWTLTGMSERSSSVSTRALITLGFCLLSCL